MWNRLGRICRTGGQDLVLDLGISDHKIQDFHFTTKPRNRDYISTRSLGRIGSEKCPKVPVRMRVCAPQHTGDHTPHHSLSVLTARDICSGMKNPNAKAQKGTHSPSVKKRCFSCTRCVAGEQQWLLTSKKVPACSRMSWLESGLFLQ